MNSDASCYSNLSLLSALQIKSVVQITWSVQQLRSNVKHSSIRLRVHGSFPLKFCWFLMLTSDTSCPKLTTLHSIEIFCREPESFYECLQRSVKGLEVWQLSPFTVFFFEPSFRMGFGTWMCRPHTSCTSYTSVRFRIISPRCEWPEKPPHHIIIWGIHDEVQTAPSPSFPSVHCRRAISLEECDPLRCFLQHNSSLYCHYHSLLTSP